MSKQMHRKKWRIYQFICVFSRSRIDSTSKLSFNCALKRAQGNILSSSAYALHIMQGNRILERQSFFSSFVIFWLSARPDICRILLHPYIPQFSPGHFTLQCWRRQFPMEMLNINFTNFFIDSFISKLQDDLNQSHLKHLYEARAWSFSQ